MSLSQRLRLSLADLLAPLVLHLSAAEGVWLLMPGRISRPRSRSRGVAMGGEPC